MKQSTFEVPHRQLFADRTRWPPILWVVLVELSQQLKKVGKFN